MDYSKIDNSGIWVKKWFKIDVTRIVDLWQNKIESKCNSVLACRPYDAIQEKMKEKERHMAKKCSYAFIGLTWILFWTKHTKYSQVSIKRAKGTRENSLHMFWASPYV